MTWYYKGNKVTSEQLLDFGCIGFVYLITDLLNNKKYVGKKLFITTKKMPPLKGKVKKRSKIVETDWLDYYGSSDEVKLLVEQHGEIRFKREIIHLCRTKGEMSYLEAKEQFDREVLLNDQYYNEFISVKIHCKHVSGLKNDSNRERNAKRSTDSSVL